MALSSGIKSYVRFVLQEAQDDIYGEYLFGEERPDVFEKDTPEEHEIAHSFESAFEGSMLDVDREDILRLLALRASGKYNDVLDVPQKFSRVWRVVEIDSETNPQIALGTSTLNRPIAVSHKSFEMPMWNNYPVVSWTIGTKATKELILDEMSNKNTVVVFSCDLTTQRDKFILNPSKMTKISDNYSWQAEVWQVQPVKVDVWAACNKKWLYENPAKNAHELFTVVEKG